MKSYRVASTLDSTLELADWIDWSKMLLLAVGWGDLRDV
jgi:hypothetical protein